ncbi:hypothetical protein Pmani_011994 [Petrolisthes manimaculis]|uniref:Major facilitator superfamily (MFS) profile domain-containing protein n=1 Tax=Petrolisthes manimaculis TaxID=1843537 RepID=A0AAE1Q1R4_9EUCA|nr:hypothetical protein Pmani_011994 [Petrolisthes manimaculis]
MSNNVKNNNSSDVEEDGRILETQIFKPQDWNGVQYEGLQEPRLDTFLLVLKQVGITMGLCLAALNSGMMSVWPNSSMADLINTNTTIYGSYMALTPTQIDMLGAMTSIGSMPGTWLGGVIVARLGRRRSVVLLLVPCVLGWGLVALAVNPTMLLAGRFVNGISCGLMLVAGATYCVELTDTKYRGAMALMPTIFLILGYIIIISLGLTLRWFQSPIVGIAIGVAGTIVMKFIPESPSYLSITGREDQARRVLKSLRSPQADIDAELYIIRNKNIAFQGESIFRVILQKDIAKSLCIVIPLFLIHNFCGIAILLINSTRIFQSSGSILEEGVCSLLMFVCLLIGLCLSVFLQGRFGRRKCLLASLLGGGVCMGVFSTFQYCKQTTEVNVLNETSVGDIITQGTTLEMVTKNVSDDGNSTINWIISANCEWTMEHTWVPLACLLVFMLVTSIGILPVPYILASEYFPTAVRAQMSSICVTLGSGFNMVALLLYTPMQTSLTPAGLYGFCSAVCFLGLIYSWVFVRETTGKHIG